MCADISHESTEVADSLTAFEQLARQRAGAARWAKIVGGGLALAGLVAAFYLSIQVGDDGTGPYSSDAAKEHGFEIAACMIGITIAAVFTGARAAYGFALVRGYPRAARGLALGVVTMSLGAGLATAAATLVSFTLAFGIEAAEQASSYYYASRAPQIEIFEWLVACVFGAAAAFFVSRADHVPTDASERPSRGFVMRRLAAVGAGLVAMFGVALGWMVYAEPSDVEDSFMLGALMLGAVIGLIVMFVARPRSDVDKAAQAARSEARDDEMVQDALGEMRRGTRRRWMAGAASAVVSFGTFAAGYELSEVVYSELPRSEQPGLMSFFALVAASVAVGLLLHKRLTRTPARADGGSARRQRWHVRRDARHHPPSSWFASSTPCSACSSATPPANSSRSSMAAGPGAAARPRRAACWRACSSPRVVRSTSRWTIWARPRCGCRVRSCSCTSGPP